MQTVFVTGAEGFAGSLLTHQLRRRGYTVVAGVRNRARKLAYEREHGKAIVCDVSDAINVARAIASARPDGVIHLAGTSHPQAATDQPLTAYQSIVTAWANVLDAVRRVCPRARVLMISACDVYGNAGQNGRPLPEDTQPRPVSTFGALKLAAESIAHTYYQNYHLNLTIARPFHYTGPGQPESFFFGAVARRLADWDASASGFEMSLPDLDCRRDLLHVFDVVDAYERLLNDGKPNETYNVCSNDSRTCRQIVQAMAQAVRLPLNFTDEATPDVEDDVISVLWGDNSKLRDELGWHPTHTVDGAVQDLMRSYQRQTTRVR
ncbi:MAG: GDP-mannose 4,6-dehydratase [Planctomycetota bacterium]